MNLWERDCSSSSIHFHEMEIVETYSDELNVLLYHSGCIKFIHSGFIQVFGQSLGGTLMHLP
jgi:hypothetical protein